MNQIATALVLMVSQAIAADPPAGKADPAPAPTKETVKERGSYALGVRIGEQIKVQADEIDVAQLAAGLKDALAGKPKFTKEDVQAALTQLQQMMESKMEAKAKVAGEKNKREGEQFLAENKKKQGVTTLPNGLQYKVLKSGAGATPKKTDTVTVHYKGTLIDGTEFDSSFKRGQPATFQVNGVIKGWGEILQAMKVGDRWQVTIPSDLAYGERGAGQVIGPNSVLNFEIELLDVNTNP